LSASGRAPLLRHGEGLMNFERATWAQVLSAWLGLMGWVFGASAAELGEAVARLHYQARAGAGARYELRFSEKQILFNGRRLSLDETLRRQADIEAIFAARTATPRSPASACAAGEFTHEITRLGVRHESKGCLDGAEFRRLLGSYRALLHEASMEPRRIRLSN
jgi:hypothetical protein